MRPLCKRIRAALSPAGTARLVYCSVTTIDTPLSLIYLVYNEEASLHEVLSEAIDYCKEHIAQWQIVVVDDGSHDNSVAIAEEFANGDARIRLVRHEQNRGMGAAMATGVRNADLAYLVFLSSDGQAPVSALRTLAPLLQRADIALSIYARGERTLPRIILSVGLRLYMRALAGIRFELEGLYLFPTALAKELVGSIRADTFFFSFELIDKAMQRGKSTTLVEMEYRPRIEGNSRVANWSRIKRIGKEVAEYGLRKRGLR